jgi:hypothetical protein
MEWAEGHTGSRDSITGLAMFPLLPPTAILGAVSGNFTGGSQQLAVATAESIQLFGFEELEHKLLASLSMPAPVLGLQLLRNRWGGIPFLPPAPASHPALPICRLPLGHASGAGNHEL